MTDFKAYTVHTSQHTPLGVTIGQLNVHYTTLKFFYPAMSMMHNTRALELFVVRRQEASYNAL